jgi:DNA-binding beta-propeller fold protein YncE
MMTANREMTACHRVVGLFLAGVALLLTACAPIQESVKPKEARELVYPAPPDEPRFVYERTIHGSADVVPAGSDSALRLALTGEGQTTELLTKPYAVAVHRGRIFVSDSADRFIKVFDVPEGRYFKVGEDDAEPLLKPLGIDVDGVGNLYVADASAKAVKIYTRDGKFLRKISGAKLFDRLSSVSVDRSGKRLYVVDIGGVSSEHHRVMVFDVASGNHLFDIGKRGSGEGELNLPRDVVIGKEGRLYVVDSGNFRVQVFDANGKFQKNFGSIGKQTGSFARPKEIAADTEGNVYVVDSAFGNFQIFNPEGELLMFAGERSESDGPGRYMLPSGIFVDEDGRVYVVDQWYRKVDVFRPVRMTPDDGFLGMRPKVAAKK